MLSYVSCWCWQSWRMRRKGIECWLDVSIYLALEDNMMNVNYGQLDYFAFLNLFITLTWLWAWGLRHDVYGQLEFCSWLITWELILTWNSNMMRIRKWRCCTHLTACLMAKETISNSKSDNVLTWGCWAIGVD